MGAVERGLAGAATAADLAADAWGLAARADLALNRVGLADLTLGCDVRALSGGERPHVGLVVVSDDPSFLAAVGVTGRLVLRWAGRGHH